jgi:Protein of unknown function, DUF481
MTRFPRYRLLLLMTIVGAMPSQAAEGQKPESSASDVLIPQNGHALYGTFRSATSQEVIFLLDAGQTLTLKWADVKELQVHRHATIRSKAALAGTKAGGFLELDAFTIQQSQETLTITSDAKTFALSLVDLNSLSTEKPPMPPAFLLAGTVSGTGGLVSGTQTQQSLGAQIYLGGFWHPSATDWHRQVTTLNLEANNILTEQVGSPSIRTHTYDGALTHQVYVWHGLYIDGVAEAYHNSSLNLYLQQSYGGGLGKNLFTNKRNTLEARADFLYIAEHFYGGVPSIGFTGVRLREEYTIHIVPIKNDYITLIENADYTPAFNQKNAWQARGGARLNVPLSEAFSVVLIFDDNYLENAPNARKNYASSSIAVKYTIPTKK